MTASRRPILVVVPVYGARAELRRCADALVETVDTTIDSVLFVNDCGPDADGIESDLVALVAERPGFSYARNARNLGFVGTCNRAATELAPPGRDILLLNSDAVPTAGWLDELAGVLAAAPEHGIVCPRSDNATIASLPFRQRDPDRPRTPERTAEVHAALRERLPRFSVVPVAMGFCFLVRGDLIERFGLFDDAFAPGYGEENDFCLRMRRHGVLSVLAHRALVFHQAGQSFSPPQRVKLRARHERLLRRRHPDYPALVYRYLHAGADAVDVFADSLVRDDETPRIVVAGAKSAIVSGIEGVRLTVIGSAGRDPVLSARGHRIWDVAIAVGEPDGWELAEVAGFAPRLLTVSELTPESLRRAANLAATPVDDAQLRARWRETADARERAGNLQPPSPSIPSRLVGFLERHVPRVATRLRQLASR